MHMYVDELHRIMQCIAHCAAAMSFTIHDAPLLSINAYCWNPLLYFRAIAFVSLQLPAEIGDDPVRKITFIKCMILVRNIADRRCRGPFVLSLKCREGLLSSVFIFNIN